MFLSTEPQTIEDFLSAVNFISPKNLNLKYIIVPTESGYEVPSESGFERTENAKMRGADTITYAKKDLEKTHAFQNDCIKISDVPNELPRNTGTRDSFLDAALSGVNIRSPIKGPKVVYLPGNALLIKEQFLGFPKNTLMLFS